MQSIPNPPHSAKRLIVPPGLKHLIKEFEIHVKIGEKKPMMICGPSGVGKSLFLHIYKKLCREKYGPDCRIETVNCSHFNGELARSELFGHIKGAFTGAEQDKEGWLKFADNDILVLEEIGDLPKETQANLLTFVETCEFHKVGSTQTETAKVQIVAATNREKNLRTDFRHRFFPFYIPPLYKRRQDILYYLADLFPQLIATLAPWEVTALLAYNWPGNVREIEKIGRLLMCQKQARLEDTVPELSEDVCELLESDIFALPVANSNMNNAELKKTSLCALSSETTAIKGYRAFQLYNSLKNYGVDVEYLETLLNSFNMGLTINNDARPLEHFNNNDLHANIIKDKRFDVALYPPIAAFTAAYSGIRALSTLFWSNVKENANLLDIQKTDFNIPFVPINRFFKLSSRNIALFNSITAYIHKNKRNDSTLQADCAPKNRFDKAKSHEETELGNISHTKLMKLYLNSLLKRTGGNQAQAARIAGLKYTTFRQKLKKFKVV
ncbi:sigma 54-interacting transcriptional regulator [Desulfococcaceae bacterium HSG9]|nr:sigma 54-interacting transcriptional regulator [Desulfococcaceae bacterium HSG9]